MLNDVVSQSGAAARTKVSQSRPLPQPLPQVVPVLAVITYIQVWVLPLVRLFTDFNTMRYVTGALRLAFLLTSEPT